MKYFGEPLSFVVDYEKLKHVFQFDKNGTYETDDEKLIQWMKKRKPHIKAEENAASDIIKCKKCNFTADNKGNLMAHYRKEHPKAGD